MWRARPSFTSARVPESERETTRSGRATSEPASVDKKWYASRVRSTADVTSERMRFRIDIAVLYSPAHAPPINTTIPAMRPPRSRVGAAVRISRPREEPSLALHRGLQQRRRDDPVHRDAGVLRERCGDPDGLDVDHEQRGHVQLSEQPPRPDGPSMD